MPRMILIWRYDEQAPTPDRPLYRVHLPYGKPVFSADYLLTHSPEGARLPGEPEEGPMLVWRSSMMRPRPDDLWAEMEMEMGR